MLRNRVLVIASLTLLTTFTKVQAAAQETVQPASRIASANTQFAFAFFHSVVAKRADSNVMVAPTGMSLTFALLDNGADSEARNEIEDAFGFKGLELQQINEGFFSCATIFNFLRRRK